MKDSGRAPQSVLVVDDHAVVREGYKRLLEQGDGLRVVGEASTAEEGVQCFKRLRPDAVLLDVAMPGVSGIEALRRILIEDAGAKVLMFSMYEDLVYAHKALSVGALGYVSKASAPLELIRAVKAVAAGEQYISHDIALALAMPARSTERAAALSLSAREFEIMRLIVEGVPLQRIAALLHLSAKTVGNHQSIIRAKLGAANALQFVQTGERILGKGTPRDAS